MPSIGKAVIYKAKGTQASIFRSLNTAPQSVAVIVLVYCKQMNKDISMEVRRREGGGEKNKRRKQRQLVNLYLTN